MIFGLFIVFKNPAINCHSPSVWQYFLSSFPLPRTLDKVTIERGLSQAATASPVDVARMSTQGRRVPATRCGVRRSAVRLGTDFVHSRVRLASTVRRLL